jgi:G3E family GTPase
VRGWIVDDVAVVVVNAEQLRAGRDLEGTFEQQVSSADLLALNKIDLVPASELPRLERRLREFEPEAPILRTVHADLDPALLFPPDPDGLRARRRAEAPEAPPHGHESVVVEEIQVDRGIDSPALLALLEPLDTLRAKGFVATREGPRVVQGVGARIELEEPDVPPPPALIGRVVVIRRA